MAAGQGAHAVRPGIACHPDREPGSDQPEDDLPRDIGEGAQAWRQHARHGDRHQQVRHVGVDNDGAAPPRARRPQSRRAHHRDPQHEGGDGVEQPGGGHPGTPAPPPKVSPGSPGADADGACSWSAGIAAGQ